jgi:adenylate cyclase 3
VTGNVLLLLGSISLGLLAYLVSDSRQRRAFLDTRQSFEMRLTIEEQAREQVNICSFSIFPGSIQWSLTSVFSFSGTPLV